MSKNKRARFALEFALNDGSLLVQGGEHNRQARRIAARAKRRARPAKAVSGK